MVGSRIVERSIEFVAQRGREGCFVARLHLQRVDQRRPQVARGPQQIGKRADRRKAIVQRVENVRGAFVEDDMVNG